MFCFFSSVPPSSSRFISCRSASVNLFFPVYHHWCNFNFHCPSSSPPFLLSFCHPFSALLTESSPPLQPTMLKKTLQCLEGIHLSQSGSLLMLYVDKLLSTPFRVLARMVDTLACRRVEMLLAETLQVRLMYGFAFSCHKLNM